MKNQLEKNKIVPSKTITIAPSKMFTYPTRLASAWEPRIMEINLPEYQLDRPEIRLTVRQDSTQSLGIAESNFYKKLYKRFTAPIQMEEEYIYDARYDTDGNIAHILTNIVPALLVAKEICPKITVVLREKATTMAKNAYKVLGFPLLCTDKEVCGKLIFPSDGSQGVFEAWYSSIFGNLEFEDYNKHTPERVFISRKGSRSLINENEVEQTLQEYGFQKFYFEDIPISEQWSITRNAKVLVAMHGAAMASLVFNRNAVKVVELFHPGYVADMYRHMTNTMGGTWCGVTGQITENVIKELDFKQNARSFALLSTRIDTTSLRMALDYLGVDQK
jgi:capsular polysaccharide biosynthesis protein